MRYKAIIFALLLAVGAFTQSLASDTLYNGDFLSANQYIQSYTGKYKLIMQSDGNLVMYRADNSVRYVMATGGSFAVMQTDGNFVEYNSNSVPVWATYTNNGLPNTLRIQDDGNLVVYNPSFQGIWSIGAEKDPKLDPTKVGDVVGRDLAFTGAGYPGHLGVWDGTQIYDVGPPTVGTNAVHITSLAQFKNTPTTGGGTATYWGVASYNIPSGTIENWGCWDAVCTTPPHTYTYAEARASIALRARQIYRIGADYTTTTYKTRAIPAGWGYYAERGKYRCDTFILDALYTSVWFVGTNWNSAQNTWYGRYLNLENGIKTPQTIFDKLKTFQ